MTNFEKYKKQILEFIANNKGSMPAMVDGKFVECGKANCHSCVYFKEGYRGIYCGNRVLLWLYEEYQEPPVDWSTVAVDTPILVSNSKGNWYKRYFAKYEDGTVFAWLNGGTSWSADIPRSWNYAKLAEEVEGE